VIAEHERLHLKYVAVHRGVPSDVLAEANRSIDAFEKGEPCPEPMEGEGVCAAHYPVIGSSHLTNEETDRRIQSVLQMATYLNSPIPNPPPGGIPETEYCQPSARSLMAVLDEFNKQDAIRAKAPVRRMWNIPGSNPASGESLKTLKAVMQEKFGMFDESGSIPQKDRARRHMKDQVQKLARAVKEHEVVLVVGERGCGKHEMCMEAIKSLGLKPFSFEMSVMTPEELNGIPRSLDQKVKFPDGALDKLDDGTGVVINGLEMVDPSQLQVVTAAIARYTRTKGKKRTAFIVLPPNSQVPNRKALAEKLPLIFGSSRELCTIIIK